MRVGPFHEQSASVLASAEGALSLTVKANVFAGMDGPAVRLYEPVRDVRFEGNVLLRAPGLLFKP